MFNCRLLSSPNLPRTLHVHDDPGYVTDALRNHEIGWLVDINKCLAPDLPYQAGDSKVVVHTTIDLVSRGN